MGDASFGSFTAAAETVESENEDSVASATESDYIEYEPFPLPSQVQISVPRVNVALRLRGPTPREQEALRLLRRTKKSVPDECVTHSDGRVSLTPTAYSSTFQVDNVYDKQLKTRDVFLHAVHPRVCEFLDGQNACVFMSGHNASGKSYTTMGFVDLAVQFLTQLQVTGVSLSCMEIFTNQLRDLFAVDPSAPIFQAPGETGLPASLSCLPVDSIASMPRILRLIQRRRSTRPSSNSLHLSLCGHLICVFTMQHADGRPPSLLTFVDLASAIQQTRVDPAVVDSNRSIHALSEVLRHLVNQDKYVPWRMHRFTQVLQECIQGDAKLMVLGMSSTSSVVEAETRNTLAFLQMIVEARKRTESKDRSSIQQPSSTASSTPVRATPPANSQTITPSALFETHDTTMSADSTFLQQAGRRRSLSNTAVRVKRDPQVHLGYRAPPDMRTPGQSVAFTEWLVHTVAHDPDSAQYLLKPGEVMPELRPASPVEAVRSPSPASTPSIDFNSMKQRMLFAVKPEQPPTSRKPNITAATVKQRAGSRPPSQQSNGTTASSRPASAGSARPTSAPLGGRASPSSQQQQRGVAFIPPHRRAPAPPIPLNQLHQVRAQFAQPAATRYPQSHQPKQQPQSSVQSVPQQQQPLPVPQHQQIATRRPPIPDAVAPRSQQTSPVKPQLATAIPREPQPQQYQYQHPLQQQTRPVVQPVSVAARGRTTVIEDDDDDDGLPLQEALTRERQRHLQYHPDEAVLARQRAEAPVHIVHEPVRAGGVAPMLQQQYQQRSQPLQPQQPVVANHFLSPTSSPPRDGDQSVVYQQQQQPLPVPYHYQQRVSQPAAIPPELMRQFSLSKLPLQQIRQVPAAGGSPRSDLSFRSQMSASPPPFVQQAQQQQQGQTQQLQQIIQQRLQNSSTFIQQQQQQWQQQQGAIRR
eukprot:TRINITY_DN5436_c0_g3_i1.p1 TRINITY_DN5436_c0_g3~~TRINITY_DN5436_c0_g3_i1.p1  ORF type:complete len:934 (-),score=196.51 TRINITY_DN5436_c0_g3_i1:66-2831(-)